MLPSQIQAARVREKIKQLTNQGKHAEAAQRAKELRASLLLMEERNKKEKQQLG